MLRNSHPGEVCSGRGAGRGSQEQRQVALQYQIIIRTKKSCYYNCHSKKTLLSSVSSVSVIIGLIIITGMASINSELRQDRLVANVTFQFNKRITLASIATSKMPSKSVTGVLLHPSLKVQHTCFNATYTYTKELKMQLHRNALQKLLSSFLGSFDHVL